MRKIIILFVVIAFAVLSIESSTISNAIAQITYLINDDMESYDVGTFPSAGGWYNRFSGSGQNAIDNVDAQSGSKSFRLQGAFAHNAIVENHNAGWQSGNIIMGYELYIYSPDGGGTCCFWEEFACYGMIFFNIDGYVYAGGTQIMPYLSNQWYKVKAEIKSNGDFSVWINDIFIANNFVSSPLPDRYISDSHFTISTIYDYYVWYDDVKVWYRPAGLVAYYPFNGNANDESGNGNHGTVNGATLTTDRFGISERAYNFDGIDYYINIDDHANSVPSGSSDITVSAWANWTSLGSNNQSIVVSYGGNLYDDGFILTYSSPDKLTFYIGQGSQSWIKASSGITPVIGNWYHLVGVYDHSKISLYINGELKAQTNYNGDILSANTLRIGNEDDGYYFLNGVIDDVRIYNRTLSEQEIQTLYDEGVPVELSYFNTETGDGLVILNWTTQSETENYGFHIYRSQIKDGEYEKITNELIPGTGNSDQAHTYSYIDRNVVPGESYYYKLADVDFSGNTKFHRPISVTVEAIPTNYSLGQNYPNPFNPETAINFSIKEAGKVTLKIYNLQGQVVRILVDEEKQNGSYSVIWRGTDEKGAKVASGTYLYILQVNGFEQIKKLVFMK